MIPLYEVGEECYLLPSDGTKHVVRISGVEYATPMLNGTKLKPDFVYFIDGCPPKYYENGAPWLSHSLRKKYSTVDDQFKKWLESENVHC